MKNKLFTLINLIIWIFIFSFLVYKTVQKIDEKTPEIKSNFSNIEPDPEF